MKIYTYNINDMTPEIYLRYYKLLSPHKKKKVDSFKDEIQKKLSVAGEMLARKHIANSFDTKEENIHFNADNNGKPYVTDYNIHFNISHSGNFCVCAIGDKPVGVDIEAIRPTSLKAAQYAFNDAELYYIFKKEPSNDDFAYCEDKALLERFFTIWTIKEAYCKYTGLGIKDIKSIDALQYLDCAHIHKDGYCISIITK